MILYFGNTQFRFSFMDKLLERDLFNAFSEAAQVTAVDYCYEIVVSGYGPYCINYCNMNKQQSNLSRGQVVFNVSVVFNEALRRYVSNTICTLHASSVSFKGSAITLIGPSGSGKSTLSLILSKHCNIIGDEYAFVDMQSNSLSHAPYPIQIKAGSCRLFPEVDFTRCLKAESEIFSTSYFLSINQLDLCKPAVRKPTPLKVIVFPKFDYAYNRTTIKNLELKKLPRILMASIASSETPSELYSRFLAMVASNNIKLLTMSYCDSEAAAFDLLNHC